MNTFTRDLKGEKKKILIAHLNNLITVKKKQVIEAKNLVKSYKWQLNHIRKIKNSELPINQVWVLKAIK